MNDNIQLDTVTSPVAATYTTDSMRKVRNEETKKVEVKRWVEERQVVASLQLDKEGGRVFHRGARIA